MRFMPNRQEPGAVPSFPQLWLAVYPSSRDKAVLCFEPTMTHHDLKTMQEPSHDALDRCAVLSAILLVISSDIRVAVLTAERT
jgi:hypothetical protein